MLNRIRVKLGSLCLAIVLPLSASAGTEIYVPLGSANAIAVIDGDSDKVVAEIPGIDTSHGLAVSVDGKYIMAGSLLERAKDSAPPKPQNMSEAEHASHHSNVNHRSENESTAKQTVGTAYLIDAGTRKLLRQIDVPGAVHHVLIMPNGRFAVLTHPGLGGVSIVDMQGHRVSKELSTGSVPNYAVSKRDGSRVYVSNAGAGTVSEIDVANWKVLRNIPAGKTPEHIVLSPDEQYLYVANPESGTASRIDLSQGKVIATYDVGRDTHGVDISDDGRLLYASSKEDNRVIAFNLATNSAAVTIPLSPAPYHIATVHGTGKVYVSSRNASKIWVLDQHTLAIHGEIAIHGEGHEMGVVSR